jgi:glutamyl-tRNA reductase
LFTVRHQTNLDLTLSVTIFALGLSHHSAALSLRERLAINAPELPETLLRLKFGIAQKLGISNSLSSSNRQAGPEIALLSTCNRTELYWHGSDPATPAQAQSALVACVAELGGLTPEELGPHLYQRSADHAARHAFRVASGLDSMVIGETQILGQLKNAVRAAKSAGTLGSTLHQLFDRSFTVAKAVRSSTELGSHSISMAAAAVRLSERVFGHMNEVNVLLIGAGEMIELTATHFAAHHPKTLTLSNRTESRALPLQQRFDAQFIPLQQLADNLHKFDVIVTCTASSVPILGLGAIKRSLKTRRNRPQLIVDLAVPRDVESEAKSLQNLFLYTVDDLAQVVQQGKDQRQAAVEQAEDIVEEGVQDFMAWMARRKAVPLIQELNVHVEAVRTLELQRALRALERGEVPQVVLEGLSRSLLSKVMHGTYKGIRVDDPHQRERNEQAVREMWLQNSKSSTTTPNDQSRAA